MPKEAPYRPRLLEPRLERLLTRFPVLILTGPRQAGKSTLALRIGGLARRYRTLDDPDELARALRDPRGYVAESAEPLTLDETQLAPGLFPAIKMAVDADRRPGRFLLTGSGNLLQTPRLPESLAGRAAYVALGPMTEGEKRGEGSAGCWDRITGAGSAESLAREAKGWATPSWDWAEAALEGGFPQAALGRSGPARADWFEAYARTFLEHDLRPLSEVASLPDYRRMMRLAALRIGRLLNQADLARDAGLTHVTAHRWLNWLEISGLIHRLPPYFVNRTKRLVKAPRLYWGDTGLGAFLAGIPDPEALRASPLAGGFLENLVLLQAMAWRETLAPRPELCGWRTVSGLEVDLVLDMGRRLVPVEVKAGPQVRVEETRGLEAFLGEYPEAPYGVLLYGGAEVLRLSKRIVAIPIAAAV